MLHPTFVSPSFFINQHAGNEPKKIFFQEVAIWSTVGRKKSLPDACLLQHTENQQMSTNVKSQMTVHVTT